MSKIKLILPTGPNVLLAMNNTILNQYKQGKDTIIDLPSLRRRAYLIVNETSLLPFKEVDNK